MKIEGNSMKFSVTGMGCAACQTKVNDAVKNVKGVKKVNVSLLTNSMELEGDFSSAEIIEAVENAGYGASVVTELDLPINEVQDKETKNLENRLITSVLLMIPLMYTSMGVMMFGWPLFGQEHNHLLIGIFQMVLSIAIIIINRAFFINGWKGVKSLSPNMDTLVALGSGAAFVYSVVALIFCAMHPTDMPDYYFECGSMILTLITVGKLLESISKGKTTNAIRSLMNLSPKKVTVLRDGIASEIAIEEVVVGDLFIVQPGDSFPVDGVVYDGISAADESALTGESVLVDKTRGDEVFSGTINYTATLTCEAKKVGEDTTLSQIIKMVSEAAVSKAPIEKKVDKIAKIFVPTVIGIAIITAIVWFVIGINNPGVLGGEHLARFVLSRAISVLVISCPCALGLATPVVIMVGSGVGAKMGVLFKNAESIEQAGHIECVAIDKTGTITEGKITTGGVLDHIRSDSTEAVKDLHKMGIKVMMLSGDDKYVTKRIADEVDADGFEYELKPEDKSEYVKEYAKTQKVAMVGDGINDAIALTTADVGIAIGSGKDVAIDAADIVLIGTSIKGVAKAFKLSKKVIKNINENLFWALIYNLICIPIAIGIFIPVGLMLNPMISALCMSISSVCVVLNSLRLNLFKSK